MGRNRWSGDRQEVDRDRDIGRSAGLGDESRHKVERVRFDDADTAFILGRGGKTKQKICRVSGAHLDLHERNNIVEISGTDEERRKARKYIDLVRAQRVGPVHVSPASDDGDLTVMDVPTSCVGFVTGSGGNFLRTCEDEWGTLMFFCDYQGPVDTRQSEQLAIFGPPTGRAGAELKVMAAIETKIPGQFTTGLGERHCQDEWGADTLPLGSDELSFALGQGGSTRKKLARASGCIIEYVGNIAHMVGTKAERRRARDYLSWLIQQRTGPVYVDTSCRDDALAVSVPADLTGLLKGTALRDIEQETDTFCFLEGDVDSSSKLLIFGASKGRKQAERKVRDLIRVRPRQAPAIDHGDRSSKTENVISAEVRVPSVLAGLIEPEKLVSIQNACGARLTQQGSDSVIVEGYDHQVGVAKKQLHEYMYNIKVEEEFSLPKDVPFHVLIAKGPDGKPSVLETVRNQTRVRVKVMPEEKKVVLAGLFSVTANAKRELQTFLSSFVTHLLHLERRHLPEVSSLGKSAFPKMQHFRYLCAAQINKDECTLTLSGAPDAVVEAHACVDSLFKKESWPPAVFEVYSLKHTMKMHTRGDDAKGKEGRSGKAAEILQLEEKDSAFILGRAGKTKHKIARVSGATLELHEQTNTVEIIGTDHERRRARKYIELVRAQRVGPVSVSASYDDGDLTMRNVPHSCVGFVTGTQGNFLRACEEEWGTLMFFCDYQGPSAIAEDNEGAIERLAIFGSRAGRAGAELKVMAAIETKIPGFYSMDARDVHSPDEWGLDTLPLGDEELSFALGKDGSTRKKLARASGCILEYIGNTAYMIGSLAARGRARDYLAWLMKQRTGTVYVDVEGRNDATVVEIPDGLIAVESVFKSVLLRSLEQETKTFCFLEGSASKAERLLIFSVDKTGREKAKTVALERIQDRLSRQGGSNHSGGQRRGNGDDDYAERWDGSWGSYGEYDTWGKREKGPREPLGRRSKGGERGGVGNASYGYYDRGSAGHSDDSARHNRKSSRIVTSGTSGYSGKLAHDWPRNAGYMRRDGHDERSGEWHHGHGEAFDVTETFAFKGDISIHVAIQTGPNGEDPVIEDIEHATGTRMTLQRDKGVIQIIGSIESVGQAKKQFQLFVDKFVTCKIQMRPEITAVLANKVSHYIRPMPWIASAEIDEQRDLLRITGHEDSVDQTFEVLREVYRDHGLELTEADVVTKKKGSEDLMVTTRVNAAGRCTDIMRVSELDAAFILGRGGKTKQKIARVSGATLELQERNNTVEISGGDLERKKARKYVELVRAQRAGPVNVDESHDDGDLTMIAVPHNCVGFVTGAQGNFLRTCEEEWGTLMFFCDYQGPSSDGYGAAERLAIFGELTGRCGAELKVMAAIETKIPGYYTTNLGDTHSEETWGTDTVPLQMDQLSYALGKKGSTRRKLARASGAIMEYVGNVAFLAGPLEARQRGREYLRWLCDQVVCKTERISIDPRTRNDVTLVPVPRDCIGYVMGDKRKTLSKLEEDWETLIFFVDRAALPNYDDVEGLAIFGDERGRAGTELKVMGAVETKIPQFFTRGVGDVHCPQKWGVDTLPLGPEELSFALGKDGGTRRKLARASGCILEYVGNVAYMAGTIAERLRAREYLRWLMRQRVGSITVDVTQRSDIRVIAVPDEVKGLTKSSTLREVEKETGTFCFFQGDISTANQLLICGHREEDRVRAESILLDILSRGASQPKARKRVNEAVGRKGFHSGVQGGKGNSLPSSRKRGKRPTQTSLEESQSSSDTKSEPEYARSDGEHKPAPSDVHRVIGSSLPDGSSAARRRQWASQDSAGESDEEIVPYW